MEKIYTQEDMDNIVSKAKTAQAEKYGKTHIEMSKYKELENKVNNMSFAANKESFKETFKNSGGNVESYEDFISLNKDLLTMDKDKANKVLTEMKTTKKHFFNQDNGPTLSVAPSDEAVVKELANEKSKDTLIDGTLYRFK